MTASTPIYIHLPMLEPYVHHPEEHRLDNREFIVLKDNNALIEALPDIEILVTFRPPPGHWEKAERLRFIQIPAAGVDGVANQLGLSDDVVLCNASGTHEPEMSEFVIAMLHAVTYRVPQMVDQQREHTWRTPLTPGHAIEGGRMCVVGLGTIGTNIARRAAALGMDVVGVRHSGKPVDGVRKVVTPDRRLEVIEGATALVVVTPLTEATRGMIGTEELAALAPGAVLVDVSRGGVTRVDALTAALESRHLFGAAVDVFATEPLPADSPLWDTRHLLVTPHTAGTSADYQRRTTSIFADNLEAFERGEIPPGRVDRTLGY